MNSLWNFWGKADKDGQNWHPAICHMLDVGIVAREILRLQPPAYRHRFTRFFKLQEDAALDALAFVISLHDIGKISPGFQNKRPDLCLSLKEQGFRFPLSSEEKHGRVTRDVADSLIDDLDCDPDGADAVARILAAHHGIFDECGDVQGGDQKWEDARRHALAFLAEVFGVSSIHGLCIANVPDLFLLAGLVSVADWIGSDESLFSYSSGPPSDLTHYMEERQAIATSLLNKLSLGTSVKEERPFSALFEFDTPNSCQLATIQVVSQLRHPMLVVVETPMGSGKTEAAQAAYAHVAPRDGLRGMYCALPTQATGNAMFDRMESFLSRLHERESVELHLIHAGKDLYPEYERLRMRGVEAEQGNVIASSWFTARKRGLLAAYGAGTIDQALLSVLRVKHFFVRLFGLGGKMIIMDEVHAYDAYMSEEIYSLIGWASRCGSSVVLLSATLPAEKRARLLQAFSPDAALPQSVSYPSVFGVDLGGREVSQSVAMKGDHLELCPIVAEQHEKVAVMADKTLELAGAGGCIACIMNTVREAQELYDALLAQGVASEELTLFHSRFTVERRLEIEEEILRKYGKDQSQRPHRGIVVASPVLQESLDVSFDAMISEIAPIDLLLQRAGRLHRHSHDPPSHLRQRRLYVCMPDSLSGTPDFGVSELIYFADLLVRTADLFTGEEHYQPRVVHIPRGVSPLIEQVYGEAETSRLNEARQKWMEKREGENFAGAYHARSALLESVHLCSDDPGYLGLLQNSGEEEGARTTRLGRQRVMLVLVKQGEDIRVRSREDERRLYRKSIGTDNVRLVAHFADSEPPEEWAESPLLLFCRPVELVNGQGQVGDLELHYNHLRGLSLEKKKGGRM